MKSFFIFNLIWLIPNAILGFFYFLGSSLSPGYQPETMPLYFGLFSNIGNVVFSFFMDKNLRFTVWFFISFCFNILIFYLIDYLMY